MNGTFLPLNQGEINTVRGVPFAIERDAKGVAKAVEKSEFPVRSSAPVAAVLLSGMVTADCRNCDWWGPDEFWYNYSARTFLGDLMGYVKLEYDHLKMETIPLLYGVTVWSYELVHHKKPYEEESLQTFGSAPFQEPFKSDPQAAALLDGALRLNENPEGDKGTRYVLAVKANAQRELKRVSLSFLPKPSKPFITAVTLVLEGTGIPFEKTVSHYDFLNKSYLDSVDKLSRRLYQYKDELPQTVAPSFPEGYGGMRVSFEGNSNVPQIFGNVFHHNLWDMSRVKIDETGMPHTSSTNTCDFGCYTGNGMFARVDGGYSRHIWTRDVGRTAIETANLGESRNIQKYAEVMNRYLDCSDRFELPKRWMRIANIKELGLALDDIYNGKENDGHASVMLSIYNAYRCGDIDGNYLKDNMDSLKIAVDCYQWQVDHPELSNFEKVLWSESEASVQGYSVPDLFSNVSSVYALEAYGYLFEDAGEPAYAKKSRDLATLLREGIDQVFLSRSEKWGEIYHDCNYDCWTYDYKRYAYAFQFADVYSYDLSQTGKEMETRLRNSYKEQKSRFFNAYSGRQMGYGQAYLTQAAMMLDEVEDYSKCMEAESYFCYHQYDSNYIVPEGVVMHPTGKYWYRNSDQGNAVQQAEIMKTARLLLGVDDLSRTGALKLIPRLPNSFDGFSVKDFKLHLFENGRVRRVFADYAYRRTGSGYRLTFQAKELVLFGFCRIGPFDGAASLPVNIKLDGKETLKPYRWQNIANHAYVFVAIDGGCNQVEIAVG